MIYRLLSTLVVFISLAVAKPFDYKKFSDYAAKTCSEWGLAGLAYAIVEDGKITEIRPIGQKSAATCKALTKDTVFPIASLSKAFSSLLMIKLEEEGKIDINTPVVEILPNFKLASDEATQGFTVAKLFQHRSGLPTFAYDTLVETGWSESEIYGVLDQINPINPFDEKFDYQNIFPGLFGWVAEKVTEKTLNTLLAEEIFIPLAMTSASVGEDGTTPSDSKIKSFWQRIKTKFSDRIDQHYLFPSFRSHVIKGGNPAIYRFPASRGVNASITDMAKWLQFWMNDGITSSGTRLISEAGLAKLQDRLTHVGAPQGGRLFPKERVTDIHYGMGWYIHDYGNIKRVLAHMGGMTGTRSLIAYAPEKKIGLVVLSNVGGMRVNLAPEALRSKFLDMVADIDDDRDWSLELKNELIKSRARQEEQRKEYRLKNPQPARTLETYVGTYENSLYGQLEIRLESGRLTLNYRDLSVSLNHWNGDNFSFPPSDFTKSYSVTDTPMGDIIFGVIKDGKTDLCMMSALYEGKDTRFKRVK
ncbi:MAG: serine hydrolase [Candidatus Paracaedibacteraceae bacterium]|nr:serine hydrolase [Candidatus Paracaedibacteraceae bacterium]